MATLTEQGRIFFAETLFSSPFYLAWGTGNSSWDTNFQSPSGNETDLVREIARRKAVIAEYCTPDENGAISVQSGKYSRSEVPTSHIHLRFEFSLEDSPSQTIRECGVYSGTVINDDVPEDTEYFLPEHISEKGRIVFIERFQALVLSEDFRRTFDFVISL